MLRNKENNGMEEVDLATPTPGLDFFLSEFSNF